MDLIEEIEPFFRRHFPSKEIKLLVAVSYGPDSMALLHTLIELGYKGIEVVHVHHGWRKESDEEEAQLLSHLKGYSIPVHLCRLTPQKQTGNLEERCRVMRYRLFQQVYRAIQAEGLCLGHQKDEQVETIVKRWFEGTSWKGFEGMVPKRTFEGMNVYRPLLFLSKQEILHFLDQKSIPYAHDPSNRDERYLRGRMRSTLIPLLEENFGKSIGDTIVHFGLMMGHLFDHFESRIRRVLKEKVTGPYGDFYPSALLSSLDWCERWHWLDTVGIKSRALKSQILDALEEKKKGISFNYGKIEIHLEEVGVFFLFKKLEPIQGGIAPPQKGWLSFFRGEFVCTLPHKRASFAIPNLGERIDGKSLHSIYSGSKVPVFLRKSVPVIKQEGKMIHQFLTL